MRIQPSLSKWSSLLTALTISTSFLNMNPDLYSDNYWNGPTPLRIPALARHAHAAYLLGTGPMPSLSPEEQATALMNAHLNSGAFAAAGNSLYDKPGRPCHIVIFNTNTYLTTNEAPALIQDKSAWIEVHVPIPPKEKNGKLSIATIDFPFDTPWGDVLSHLAARMDLGPKMAQLGWKSSDDGQKIAPRQLENEEDLRYAFCELAGLQKCRHSGKPVYMEVSNLVLCHTCLRQSACSQMFCRKSLRWPTSCSQSQWSVPILLNSQQLRRS